LGKSRSGAGWLQQSVCQRQILACCESLRKQWFSLLVTARCSEGESKILQNNWVEIAPPAFYACALSQALALGGISGSSPAHLTKSEVL